MNFRRLLNWRMALFVPVLSLTLLAVFTSGQLDAQNNTPIMRTYHIPDIGSITYPLATYSVRNWLSGIPAELEQQITFPGVITIDPNDSLIYSDEPGNVYRIRLASTVTESSLTPEDLPGLFGKLPLALYTSDILDQHPVVKFTLDGKPAVRGNDLPVGQFGLAAHIIALNGAQILEIIVEPVATTEQADQKVQVERRKVSEDMITSFKWLVLP